MPRPIRRSPEQLEHQIAEFNRRYPVGTTVCVELDSGERRTTITRSAAQILGGHSPVIWLEGVRGCYLLDRVSIPRDTTPTDGGAA